MYPINNSGESDTDFPVQLFITIIWIFSKLCLSEKRICRRVSWGRKKKSLYNNVPEILAFNTYSIKYMPVPSSTTWVYSSSSSAQSHTSACQARNSPSTREVSFWEPPVSCSLNSTQVCAISKQVFAWTFKFLICCGHNFYCKAEHNIVTKITLYEMQLG